jgi:uncharacterized protein with gpF-like domain
MAQPKLPKWQYPLSIENEYIRILNDMVSAWKKQIQEKIVPNLAQIVGEYEFTQDSWSESIDSLTKALSISMKQSEQLAIDNLSIIADQASDFNLNQWRQAVVAALGVDLVGAEPWLEDLRRDFISKNTTLIRNLTDDTLKEVQRVMSDGITKNYSHKTIEKQLIQETTLEALNIQARDSKSSVIRKTRNRARLIAEDQIGTYNSKNTELRQTGFGIKSYFWDHSDDIRVRGKSNPNGLYKNSTYDHWARQGKVYAWRRSKNGKYPPGVNPPPPDGNPGEAYRCRCSAIPNFEGILEGIQV